MGHGVPDAQQVVMNGERGGVITPLHRIQLTEAGLRRALTFNWQHTAETFSDVLQQVVDRPDRQQPRLAA